MPKRVAGNLLNNLLLVELRVFLQFSFSFFVYSYSTMIIHHLFIMQLSYETFERGLARKISDTSGQIENQALSLLFSKSCSFLFSSDLSQSLMGCEHFHYVLIHSTVMPYYWMRLHFSFFLFSFFLFLS